MPDRCPQDGGFIGRSGCTHPNHVHSQKVQALLAEKTPHRIDVADANAALNEGFYVENPEGTRVGFGWNLKGHLDNHGFSQSLKRKEALLFAIDTVRTTKPEPSKKGNGYMEYAKVYENFSVLAVSNPEGDIEEMVTFYLPKKGKTA